MQAVILAAVVLSTLAIMPPPAAADVIMPMGPRSVDVAVVWFDSIATTHVSLFFGNDGSEADEAVLWLPLSPSAVVTNLTLTTHNRTLVGAVTERNAARTAYDASKARGEEAVLLSSAGKGSLSLSVNVPAGKSARVNATWAEVVPLFKGEATYRFPLAAMTARYGALPLLEWRAEAHSSVGWSRMSSAGLPNASKLVGENAAYWNATLHDYYQTQDATMVVAPISDTYTSTFAFSRREGEATFVSALQPPGHGAPMPLDVVFVLDRSGSMRGTKIEQAREALDTILGQLRPADRFGLVSFSDTVTSWKPLLVVASATEVAAGQAWVARVADGGSTDLEGGVSAALSSLQEETSGRVPMVVLISDGLPTSGITGHREIIASLDEKNVRGARLHVIGIGLDQDSPFLNELAASARGFYEAMAVDDNVRSRLEDFYERVSTPILSDVVVAIEGIEVTDLQPSPLPDLYRGSQLVVAGRLNASKLPAETTVLVTGRDATGPRSFRFNVTTADAPIVPAAERLWARQKANSLERSIQLNEGYVNVTSQRAELLALGLRHQVETIMTSWVIVRTEDVEEVTQASGQAPPPSGLADSVFRMPGPPAAAPPAAPPQDAGLGGPDVSGGADEEPATPGLGVIMILAVVAAAAAWRRR